MKSLTIKPYSVSDYYPFGSVMYNRNYNASNYRYGFNGQEKDDETFGAGNEYDYGARIYDPRLGRFLSLDAHYAKYPAISPYVSALNSPLLFKDIDGNDAVVTVQKDENGGGKITISSTVYITGEGASEFNARVFTEQATEKYKSSIYVDENGKNFTVEFNVKFEYAPDESKIKLQDGENRLEYNKKDIVSNVPAIQTNEPTTDPTTGIAENGITITAGNKGEISKNDNVGISFRTTLHEVLHFLGLSDRYKEDGKNTDGSRKTKPNPGFEEDIMGTQSTTKINQVHYDNYGKEYSKKEAGKYILKNKIDVSKDNGKPVGAAVKETK